MRLDIDTLINLVSHSLPLSDWGFIESAKTDLYIIYNSQWCRVKFLIEKDRARDYLHVYYGRLHASDNAWMLKWNDENCYCWHNHFDIQLVIKFLDGIPPQVAYNEHLTHLKLFQDYYNSELAKSFTNIHEQFLKLHSTIWARYEIRFFELFDLRRPDLWKQYIDFLQDYYRIDDEESNAVYRRRGQVREPVNPPLHKKC